MKRREEIFQRYKNNGLNLLDVKPEDHDRLKPIRYRAIVKTTNPEKMMKFG